MPAISTYGRFVVKRVDRGGLRKALIEALQEQMKLGARAWLRATYMKVPVYQGMARGSFIPIGAFLGMKIPIKPASGSADHGNEWKTPSAGAAQSHFEFSSSGLKFYFTFSTEVEHYVYNEQQQSRIKLKNPTPWESFEAGKKAWTDYLDKHLKLPDIKSFDKDMGIDF